MKYMKNILRRNTAFNLFVFIFFIIMFNDVYALGTDYIHSQYSQEEKSKVIGYLELKKITSGEVVNESIESFDISQDGTLMAVAFSNHKIGVYDINGKWLWGLTDIDHHGGFDCEIDNIDNELLVISQREDTMYKVDKDLNVLDAVKIEHDNNGEIYPDLELTRSKIRGEKIYKMSRTKVWVEESGVKTILIDRSMEVSIKVAVYIIMVGFFVAVSVSVNKEKRNLEKKARENKESSNNIEKIRFCVQVIFILVSFFILTRRNMSMKEFVLIAIVFGILTQSSYWVEWKYKTNDMTSEEKKAILEMPTEDFDIKLINNIKNNPKIIMCGIVAIIILIFFF